MTDVPAPASGRATVEDCAAEPIRTPGAIQPHGVVLVVGEDGVLKQVSANAAALLGDAARPGAALTDAVGDTVAARLRGLDPADGPRTQTTRLTLASGAEVDVCRTAGGVIELEPVGGAQDGTATFEEAVTAAVTRIQHVSGLAEIVDGVCDLVRELTGFDRVMGYRFEPDDHGVVVAERRADELEPFLGLHYPASDIPPQARELYLRQWIRLIPDAAYTPVPMLPAGAAPIDMADVSSRAVSPIHCEYLHNMGVRSSMSISLIVDGRLWGLIACHHYSGPRRPSVPVRQACEFVALAASVVMGARLSEQRTAAALRTEQTLATLAEHLLAHDDLTTGLLADPALLPALLDADGVAVLLGGRCSTVGPLFDDIAPDHVAALAERLAREHPGGTVSTDRAPARLPGPWAEGTPGIVALPLSSIQRNYVLWFRGPWRHEVRWGGEPAKAVVRRDDGGLRLAPRASFAEWVESIEDRSRPWAPEGLAAVEQLRGLLARHISRTAEHLARLNAELVRSNAELDAFAYVAAHDLKEPLRGLANYATFLSEDYRDVLGDEGMRQLSMMTQLTGRMNGLLASLLTYARVGRGDLHREVRTLSALVADVLEFVGDRAADARATITVTEDGDVDADVDLVGQVLMNLISNAVKYNTTGAPRIEVGVTTLSRTRNGATAVRRSPLTDTDLPVVYVRDDGIGIPADRHEDIFRVFRRLHGPGEFGGGEGAGLTIARRIVERHGGTMWVESAAGAGATFHFTLGPA